MQAMTHTGIEREAVHLLPALLEEALDEGIRIESEPEPNLRAERIDLRARDSRDRLWLIGVKTSSGPAQVRAAAKQLRGVAGSGDGIPVLLVPHMSSTSAKAAEDEHLNWIDFAGNACLRDENLRVWVWGKPRVYRPRGRPASPFAPRSARIARQLLLHPGRWWRQRDLAEVTGLNDGTVSRVVRRLTDESLADRQDGRVRSHDPGLLLDAWTADYRFDRHDILEAHMSGTGIDLARTLAQRLEDENFHHAFTGLPAAWVIDAFAQFRLISVYVDGDPRVVADALELRRSGKGANVQLIGPNDSSVFAGEERRKGLNCVSIVQTYLDLQHLPERAKEAADHLRTRHLDWNGDQR